jgi:type VI secretion system secreted protein Hcp
MALSAYFKFIGQKQGEMKSDVTQKDRVGLVEVIAVSHEIVSPRDPASGLPTGKRMHKPYTVTCHFGPQTTLMYNALTSNENLTSVIGQFYVPAPDGTELMCYKVTLTNASFASIAFVMPNNKNADLMKYVCYTNVALCYQKIQWDWTKPATTAQDDWESPQAS